MSEILVNRSSGGSMKVEDADQRIRTQEESSPQIRIPPATLPIASTSMVQEDVTPLRPPPAKCSGSPPPVKRSRGKPAAKRSRSPAPAKRSRSPPPAKRSGGPQPAKRSSSPPSAKRPRGRPAVKRSLDCLDSGSEVEDMDSDGEAEWACGAGPLNLRQVSRQIREHILCHEGQLLDATANAPKRDPESPVVDGAGGQPADTVAPALLLDEAEKLHRVTEALLPGDDVLLPWTQELLQQNVACPASSDIFCWSDDFSTFSGQQEVYMKTPGPHVETLEPGLLFQAVWDPEFVAHIVRETNEYARQTIGKLCEIDDITTNLYTWKETTVEEIYRLFAIINYMSIVYRSTIDEYWTTGTLGMPSFRELMSKNRFTALMGFLHFVDNNTLHERSYDRKISKIAPVLEHCNRKFHSMYTPKQSLSLDESLLLWKGRLSWAQCIRNKAARFGVKTFELCEAESGYMLRCLLYAGKDSGMPQEAIDGFKNSTTKVVLKLMDGYLDVGHMLVMDNWYNQLALTRYLKSRRTDVIGTMNPRQVHVPSAIKAANEHMLRGDLIALHCGDITMITWKDVKLVTAISTYHNKEQVVCYGATCMKPALIDTHNRYMGGVDLKDQKLSMFTFERKHGQKWYIKVFNRLMNTSLLNTYIIYKHTQLRPLSHRDFRYKVSEDLLAAYQLVRVPRPVTDQGSLPTRLVKNAQYDHFPTMSDTVGSTTRHVRRDCRCCRTRGVRSSTTVMCRTCQVPLCLRCWVDYHTKMQP